jgi:radical SAM protein with 4Fe4S-binding SPASM domain
MGSLQAKYEFLKGSVRRKLFETFPTVLNSVDPRPSIFCIEPTNKCNLQCKMCVAKDRKQGFMEMALFNKVLSETKQLLHDDIHVHLSYGGEPFLHPKIGDMIKTVGQMGFSEVTLFTNGMLVDPYIDLIAKNVTNITFSLEGIGKVNDDIRLGCKYDLVLKNMKKLRSARIRNKIPIQISISCTWTTQKKAEIEDFVRQILQVADHVYVRPYRSTDRKLISKNFDKSKMVYSKYCSFPLTSLVVLWDGTVSNCTYVGGSPFLIGNAREQTIRQIWHSKSARDVRVETLRLGYPQNATCKLCNIWRENVPCIIEAIAKHCDM